MQQLIKVSEAATILSLSRNTIYRMMKCGKLRSRKVGAGDRSVRVVAEDVYHIVNPPQQAPYVSGSLRKKLG